MMTTTIRVASLVIVVSAVLVLSCGQTHRQTRMNSILRRLSSATVVILSTLELCQHARLVGRRVVTNGRSGDCKTTWSDYRCTCSRHCSVYMLNEWRQRRPMPAAIGVHVCQTGRKVRQTGIYTPPCSFPFPRPLSP